MGPCFLTLPAPGDRTSERLDRKVRLLALRYLCTVPERIRGLPALQRALTEAARSEPARVLDAVGAPDVLPWLLVGASGLRRPEEVLGAAVPSLFARLGHLGEPLLWEHPVSTLTDGARTWRLPVAARGLSIDPGGVSVRLGRAPERLSDLPCAETIHPIRAGVHLATADTFPLSSLEEHPEKSGNALDLADRPVEVWVAALDEALATIETALPAWAAAMPLVRLLPVGFQPERHLSASYREAPGLAWLTLHPDPLTLAEALVHEGQHSRLNALSWLDPVLHNGRTTWTRSPVRPDLRPLMGVLLAVHAFVAVSALHHALREAHGARVPDPVRLERRQAEVLASNEAGLRILEESAEPTDAGRRLLGELRALHDALRAAAGPLPEVRTDVPTVG